MNKYSIIRIIEKTLNYVDPRLIDHGKRVAYLLYKVLKRQGTYNEKQITDLITLALLHDIGAYKTEEIEEMVKFETSEAREHSIYGYLFIRNFSPLSHLAEAILFHHTNCCELQDVDPFIREQAQLIFIADRFDILTLTGGLDRNAFYEHFNKRRHSTFDSDLLDLFFSEENADLFEGIDTDDEFTNMLYYQSLSTADTDAFLRMIVLIIDFRSAQTVTHTFTSACICQVASKYLDMDDSEREHLYSGVMLHDLGKISTPISILDKTGKLTEGEMKIMKEHVPVTKDILSGNIDDCSMQLSIRHHEKLNGSGYPNGILARDLTTGQRLIAIADIFSALCVERSYKDAFPKEKVIGILKDMSSHGLLDSHIVSIVANKYDFITDEIRKAVKPIIETYEQMRLEYSALIIQRSSKLRPQKDKSFPQSSPGRSTMAVYSSHV